MLAGGFLTGKYKLEQQIDPNSRSYGNDRLHGYAIINALTDIAERHQTNVAQIAIAWLLANPTITSTIIGTNNVSQLSATLPTAEIVLSPDEKTLPDELPSPS